MLMDCCKLQDKNVHFYSNIYNRAINSSFLRIIFQKIYLQLMKVLSEIKAKENNTIKLRGAQ